MSVAVNPYISLVVSGRNDDYGGSFTHRFNVSLKVWLTLCEHYGLSTEFIIVEWNPPADVPVLADVLSLPEELGTQEVRFIQVPNEIHRALPQSERTPIFEFYAKNVGIRRARGEYVLAMNADDIPAIELVQFLVSGELCPECFYRTDVYDVETAIPLNAPVEEQLAICAEHWSKIYTVRGVSKRRLALMDYHYLYSLVKWFGGKLIHHPRSGIHTNKSGDFLLIRRDHWHTFRGYPELPSNDYVDGLMCFMAASSGLHQVILNDEKRIYHQGHERSARGNRPSLNFGLYLEQGKQIMEHQQPPIVNDENWGLRGEALPEWTFPIK
ncbi:hypothetical protein ACFLV3_01535 [Chloroflexota bacterium]